MKYGFEFTPTARRAIRTIPQAEAYVLLLALTPLGMDPYNPNNNVAPMQGRPDRYRLRAGNYRVVYEVQDARLIILVIDTGHRRDIYRGR